MGGVGESSGMDRLTDVPESGWVRRRRSPERLEKVLSANFALTEFSEVRHR